MALGLGTDRLPPYAEALSIDEISYSGPQLSIRWSVDRLRFSSDLWYSSVDFGQLEHTFGEELVRSLALHVALFEVNKGASFRPRVFSVAEPWASMITVELAVLWHRVIRKVWAQWRYEHGIFEYDGPELLTSPVHTARPASAMQTQSGSRSLWFCGGGKDSLLASKLLDHLGQSYDSLTYSHSVYGVAESQHSLIAGLIDRTRAIDQHRVYMYDTSMDLNLTDTPVYGNVAYVLAAETPLSLFAALPIALTHGYGRLFLAHEHSANVGNLIWDATGEDVNHQWGKSLEAERLLGDYVTKHLVDVKYVSVLQQVYDATIFAALARDHDGIEVAHSCNIAKPWCKRCPKCAYVWISYMAWLPWEVVEAAFGDSNLLDDESNYESFAAMLGLREHTPFECIGQIDEARLAFALARARGLKGAAMSLFDGVSDDFDWRRVVEKYLTVKTESSRLPADLLPESTEFFESAAQYGRDYVSELLGLSRA